MFEGMPWPILLPVAILALIYGANISSKEMEEEDKKQAKRKPLKS